VQIKFLESRLALWLSYRAAVYFTTVQVFFRNSALFQIFNLGFRCFRMRMVNLFFFSFSSICWLHTIRWMHSLRASCSYIEGRVQQERSCESQSLFDRAIWPDVVRFGTTWPKVYISIDRKFLKIQSRELSPLFLKPCYFTVPFHYRHIASGIVRPPVVTLLLRSAIWHDVAWNLYIYSGGLNLHCSRFCFGSFGLPVMKNIGYIIELFDSD